MKAINTITAKKLKVKNSIPVLDNILIGHGFAQLSNLDITLIVYDEGLNGFSGLIDYKTVKDLKVNEILKEGLLFELKTNKGTFKGSYTEKELETYPQIHFGTFEQIDVLTVKDVSLVIKNSKYVAKDLLRPVMCCVSVEDYITASDSYVIGYDKREHVSKNYLIPSEVVKYLDKKLEYTVFESKDYIKLTSDQEEIIYRKTEGYYPSWKRIIPNGFKHEFTLSSEILQSITDACKYIESITFVINATEIAAELSTQNIDSGKSFTTSMAITQTEGITFRLTANLITNILNTEKVKEYHFKLNTNQSIIMLNDNICLMPETL